MAGQPEVCPPPRKRMKQASLGQSLRLDLTSYVLDILVSNTLCREVSVAQDESLTSNAGNIESDVEQDQAGKFKTLPKISQ